jgi:hypothetical protein
MTTTLAPTGRSASLAIPGISDLTNRQVLMFAVVAGVVVIAALLAIAISGGEAIVPASTSVADMTAVAVAMIV